MKTYKILRTILCIYEGLRLSFLAWISMLLQLETPNIFPWTAMIVPGALFFFMALFLRLDLDRFRVYCPLYIAGKTLGIILTAIWIVISKIITIEGPIPDEKTFFVTLGIVIFMVLGEILSVKAVHIIFKKKTEAD